MPRLVILVLLLLSTGSLGQDFDFQRGEIPLILVAPHAGSGPLEGSSPRQKADSTDPHFSTSKDLVTKELANQLASHFEAGRKPSLLISNIHRKFVDLNRAEEFGAHDRAGKAFHRQFHQTLENEISRLKSEFGWVLLIDIHGQGSIPMDLILGTRRGQTIGRWSEELLWGEDGILPHLESLNYSTAPPTAIAKFRYGGGFIVQHYGADPVVEGWQIEHGKALRFEQARNLTYTTYLAGRLIDAIKRRPKQSAWLFP